MTNIIKLPPFKKFCMTIGNLPEAYVESMSYYESLCWMVGFLANEVIPTVNNNSEVVEELQQKFTELQDFVNNYFDNLDVQQEINNKLDEMVANGELANILNNYTQQQKVYNTTIDLLADTNLKENMKVKTLGYYEISDGGSADFYITSSQSNNFQIATATEGLFAELVSNGTLYIKQFGCVGDGITDDTANVQLAINELIKNENASCLILNTGKYMLSSTINIRKNASSYLNKTIKGENQAYFTVASSFTGSVLIDIDGEVQHLSETDEMLKYLTLENINIQDRTTPVQNITGISIKSSQFINLINVYIHSCKIHGLYLQDVYDSMVLNCKLIRCGFYETNVDVNNCALMLTGRFDNVNATKFYGLQVEFFNTALQIVSGRHNQFTDCKFETGNYPNLGSVQRIYIGNIAIENTFTNCQFVKGAKDLSDDSGYFINAQTGELPSPLSKFYNKFDGCMFLAGQNLSGRWFACNNCIITNSIINSCGDTNTAKSPLLLTGNNIVSNNHIINDRTYINLFDIQNNDNIISNNIIDMPNDNYQPGTFIRCNNSTQNFIFSNNAMNIKNISTYYSGLTYFNNSIIKNNTGYNVITDNTNAQRKLLLLGCDTMVLSNTTATTITEILYGYNSQTITFISTNIANQINNNQFIKTQSGQNITMEIGQAYTFKNINNVWYQI